MFDVWTSFVFGFEGYVMKKWEWPIAPLILGFILGPLMEQHLRASLQGSGGSILIFIQRPICTVFIVLGVVLILMSRTLWSKVSVQGVEACDSK